MKYIKSTPQPSPGPASLGATSLDIFHRGRFGSSQQAHIDGPTQVSYEGYTFTKYGSHDPGQKETWGVALMVPMPVSQSDLKDQIKKNRKKHVSVLDEYNNEKMKGFKRKQVDNLIRQCTNVDGDYGFEYVLASIKLDTRKTNGNIIETVSMQVILKRQLMAGFPRENLAGPSVDIHAKLPSQIMDVTAGDELREVRDYGHGSQNVGYRGAVVPFFAQASSPEFPAPSRIFGQGVQQVYKSHQPLHAPPYPHDPTQSSTQGMIQAPHPPIVPLVHQESLTAKGHLEKVLKSSQRKTASKHVDFRHDSRKEHGYSSDSSSSSYQSFDLSSNKSWAKTDVTPDTVVSGGSRENRKEKPLRKEGRERSHDKDSIEERFSGHEEHRPVSFYRGHGSGKHRRSSLSPARRSRNPSIDSFDLDTGRHGRSATSLRHSYSNRYSDYESYEVEPAVSFPADRSSRQRPSSGYAERQSRRRALSYDLGRPHHSRALVTTSRPPIAPVVYRDHPWDYGHQADWALGQQNWERAEHERRRDEFERANSERERRLRERNDREDRIRGMERRRSREIERESWLRSRGYDEYYTPRRPRDPGYYY